MKVTTDSCLFGAWAAREVNGLPFSVNRVQFLDVGTGTGLLSLMMAQQTTITIDTMEIDSKAFKQAAENIAASPWQERITVINEDVLQWNAEKRYDVILSNPPFYEQSLKSDKISKNTAHHSTQLSLEQLIHFIKKQLAADGIFFLLLPYQRLPQLQALAAQQSFFLTKIIAVRQTTNHTPFRIMVKASFTENDEKLLEEMAIKDAQNRYTNAFMELLQPYYLYL